MDNLTRLKFTVRILEGERDTLREQNIELGRYLDTALQKLAETKTKNEKLRRENARLKKRIDKLRDDVERAVAVGKATDGED